MDFLIRGGHIYGTQERNEGNKRRIGKIIMADKSGQSLGSVDHDDLYIYLGLKFPSKFKCQNSKDAIGVVPIPI